MLTLKVKDGLGVDELIIKCWLYCVCLWMRQISLLLESEAYYVYWCFFRYSHECTRVTYSSVFEKI